MTSLRRSTRPPANFWPTGVTIMIQIEGGKLRSELACFDPKIMEEQLAAK